MGFTFRPAVRESVGLILGVAGASGSGKTFSALRLAQGMAGGKAFAVIDTEARRALHYADRFRFDHGEMASPFRPMAYTEAIAAADAAGYPVIVVDSCSHEHAGDGGLLDWHEEELDRMAGSDWKKRENCKMAAWIKPKMAHKQFVQQLLQVRAHLILCFRAEQKVEMSRNPQTGKMEIQPKRLASGFSDWIPICEKNLLYELTASFLLAPDKPGVPIPIKLQEQHRAMVPEGQPLGETTGERLAAWARGGPAPRAEVRAPAPAAPAPATEAAQPSPVALVRQSAEVLGLSDDDLLGYMGTEYGTTLDEVEVETLRELYRDLRNGSVSRWAQRERGEGAFAREPGEGG